jgi:predicted AlkP superfamily phosphohydrolase/phosphomutase
MKILVIGLDCVQPGLLLGEERLSNIRRLMSAGCFGRLASNLEPNTLHSICEAIDRSGGRSILFGAPFDFNASCTNDKDALLAEIVSMTRKTFAETRELLRHNDWTYLQLVETGLDRIQHGFCADHDVLQAYYQLLDAELGTVLAMLDDETGVLVYSASRDDSIDSPIGAFVLAIPGQSARGEIEGANLIDLAPTVLELAGIEIPPAMPGRSLVHVPGMHPPVESEWFDFVDPAVEERLRGLGYLG